MKDDEDENKKKLIAWVMLGSDFRKKQEKKR